MTDVEMAEGWPGCVGCGYAHEPGCPSPALVVNICGPSLTEWRYRECPLHRQVERVALYEQDYYAPFMTFQCGVMWDAEEGWRPPEDMSQREVRRLDRRNRPEHYAKYDRRRGPHGRFAAVESAGTQDGVLEAPRAGEH